MQTYNNTLKSERSGESAAWFAMLLVSSVLQLLLCINTQYPYVIESGDNGSILYIVAQWLNPSAFEEDVLLGVQGSTSFYQAAPMWLVYLLGLTGAQVGVFFVFLCFPVSMVQMAGFYVLGKHLFAHRGVSFTLALISIPTVFTLSGDLWGLSHSPLLRSVYGAAFPWLLLLLVRPQEPRPYVLMIAAAAATYLHLPSGPPVAIILIFVSFLHGVGSRVFLRNLIDHIGAGFLYLALILPYAAMFSLNYAAGDEQSLSVFKNSPYTSVEIAIDQILSMRGAHRMEILASRVPGLGWAKPVASVFFAVLYAAGSMAMLALCVLWAGPSAWRNRLGLNQHKDWFSIAAMFVGIVSFALIVSAVDQWLAQRAGRAPLQVDFIRATRFIVPGSYIGFFFLLVWCTRERKFIGSICCAFVAVFVWVFAYPSTSHGLYRLTKGQSIEDESLTQLGRFILHMPEQYKVRPVTPILRYDYQSSALRYIGYIPLTFNRKDNNFISYSGKSDMAAHKMLMNKIDKIRGARVEPENQAKLVNDFSEALISRDIVIDRRVVQSEAEELLSEKFGYKLVYSEGLYALMRRD